MVQTHDVRREVDRYLAGNLPLRDLTMWLAAEGWELRDTAPTSSALEAIRTLDLHIAEHTNERLTRDELNDRFRDILDSLPLAETTWSITGESSRRSMTSASTEFVEAFA